MDRLQSIKKQNIIYHHLLTDIRNILTSVNETQNTINNMITQNYYELNLLKIQYNTMNDLYTQIINFLILIPDINS